MTRYLFVCLIATLCTGAASAQVAYVYVPTPKGIYAYYASTAGKLTLIKGSPFTETSGLLIGSNGKFLITLGTDYVHSYEVSSTGAIGKQVSEINTQAYGGAECGTTGGATLDHSGQYVYVNLDGALSGGDQFCATLQTFQISAAGVLTFKGDTVLDAFKENDGPTCSRRER
jgi:hypothetical protein